MPTILQFPAHGNWMSHDLILTLCRVSMVTAGQGPSHRNAYVSDVIEVSGSQTAMLLPKLPTLGAVVQALYSERTVTDS